MNAVFTGGKAALTSWFSFIVRLSLLFTSMLGPCDPRSLSVISLTPNSMCTFILWGIIQTGQRSLQWWDVQRSFQQLKLFGNVPQDQAAGRGCLSDLRGGKQASGSEMSRLSSENLVEDHLVKLVLKQQTSKSSMCPRADRCSRCSRCSRLTEAQPLASY